MSRVIQIRDVPDELHEALSEAAHDSGLSLNRFVLRELAKVGRRRRNAEIFRQLHAQSGGRMTREEIVATIRDLRENGE